MMDPGLGRQLIRPVDTRRGDDVLELLEPDFDELIGGEEYTAWVDAAPFRAHVRMLIDEFGIAWRTIAVLADVPPTAVQHLIRGRRGRPVPRLHPLIAERLFHLTAEAVGDAAVRPVHAGLTRRLLLELERRGWPAAEVAARTAVRTEELDGIASGGRSHCSQLTAATVKAAAQALWTVPSPRPAGRLVAVA